MADTGITGKVVAITGASSGIGEATALLLAQRGARLVLGARRTDRLEALAARIAAAGVEVALAGTDVRRRAEVEALVRLASDRFGRLDVMVNNAGVGLISPLDDLRVEDWDEMIDVNVRGVLHGIAAALPVFRAQGSGHISTTLSTAGLTIVPTMSVYAGTKNAVRAICEGLRQEAGPICGSRPSRRGWSAPTSPGHTWIRCNRPGWNRSRCRPRRSPAPSRTPSSSPPGSTWARSSCGRPPRPDPSAPR